jgi:hypothetical protein
MGQQMRPGMSPVNHSMGMAVTPIGAGMGGPAGSGMTAGPPVGMGGSMLTSGQMSSSVNSGVMGPSSMPGQLCSSVAPGGPVMEGMGEDGSRQMMMSSEQFQRAIWMQQQQQQHHHQQQQQQQQQHQMIRGHHPQQGPSPEYGHFPQAMQRPGTASYCGPGAGVPPQMQRLRMNNYPGVQAAGGTMQTMPIYTGGDGVRGLMPMSNPGAVNPQQQQHLMQQMQQRRTLTMPQQPQLLQQVRCQVSLPPTSMMDPGGTPQMVPQSAAVPGPRAAVKRPPPPHYADTVLTHSGPRPVIGPAPVGGDPRLGQYSSDLARMRFKPHGGTDFPMVPISATDVVRYPHDASMRFGDAGGNL